ncbi:type I-E CRISPR-associated protein Cas6/Cse3/CasE [Actinoallomurus liliacearum]|uniref:Type I-E CRISPR-associated protein Cas6/Cse3/CasE n=1 Tax=Actinoallomurus liliacearum TaxID=1080073 RepID=A0ABP8TKC0_9ACTN
MFLSKLTINVFSREFRRDNADIQDMHRTIMSAFPQVDNDQPARMAHGVLWRLDEAPRGFVLYVQSRSEPDWSYLPDDYLAEPAQVRDLQPALDAVAPGRHLAFRLTANATRTIHPGGTPGQRKNGKRVAHRDPRAQVAWLARQGERHGFVLPLAANGQPDVVPSPRPVLQGRQKKGPDRHTIRIEAIRFDGRLVITDRDAFLHALQYGIGKGRAYGCGLISLAALQN